MRAHAHTRTPRRMLHLAYLSLWYTCRHLHSDRHLTFMSSTSFLTLVSSPSILSFFLYPLSHNTMLSLCGQVFSYTQLDDCLPSEKVALISQPSHPGSLGACCGLQLVFLLLLSLLSSWWVKLVLKQTLRKAPRTAFSGFHVTSSDRQPGSHCLLCVS